VPNFLRYGYDDTNITRVFIYSAWLWCLLGGIGLIPWLYRGVLRRLVVWFVVLVWSFSGWVALVGLVDGRGMQNIFAQNFEPLIAPLELQLTDLRHQLPLEADIFYWQGCSGVTSSHAGNVFGRYATSSINRAERETYLPSFEALVLAPSAAGLRAAGYTHLYIDETWWFKTLEPLDRQRILAGAFEVVTEVAAAPQFRILLRVCEPTEGCRLPADTVLQP
jgi:hypothetical protein